jgi:hypothetical protein
MISFYSTSTIHIHSNIPYEYSRKRRTRSISVVEVVGETSSMKDIDATTQRIDVSTQELTLRIHVVSTK